MTSVPTAAYPNHLYNGTMHSSDFAEYLKLELLGNPLQDWLIGLAVALAVFLMLQVVMRAGVVRLVKLAKRTETFWDDAITEALSRTHWWFMLIIALFAGSLSLVFPDKLRTAVISTTYIALILQGGLWLNSLGMYWLKQEGERRRRVDPPTVTTITAMGFIGRLVLWSLVVILLLDNLGIDVTALVAGLGVGGIAVALAVQSILKDLFASISIVLDKPFAVGDFLIIDTHMGAVEYVGLKTTRIRSLSGEQLVFSNTDLLSSRIRNYGRMFERRVVFKLGVTYQTPRDKLKLIPHILREAILEQDKVRFDRAHFQAYGASSLDFEIVYYVLGPDYNLYMDIQQAINLRIHERFEQEGIEFAYPTQTLYVYRADDETRI